jgi:hypothetical protein
MLRGIAALFVSLSVSGCAAFNVTSTVSRFHRLDAHQGKTVVISASDPTKEQSLEFSRYATTVAEELAKYGLVPQTKDAIETSDYVLYFDYAIDMGRTVTMTVPLYGLVGGGTTHHSGSVSGFSGAGNYLSATYSGMSWSPPQIDQIGSIPISAREFTRLLRIEIVEREALRQRGVIEKVFEGRAISVGTSQLPRVFRGMVQALFERFPGRNGETFKTFYPPED